MRSVHHGSRLSTKPRKISGFGCSVHSSSDEVVWVGVAVGVAVGVEAAPASRQWSVVGDVLYILYNGDTSSAT